MAQRMRRAEGAVYINWGLTASLSGRLYPDSQSRCAVSVNISRYPTQHAAQDTVSVRYSSVQIACIGHGLDGVTVKRIHPLIVQSPCHASLCPAVSYIFTGSPGFVLSYILLLKLCVTWYGGTVLRPGQMAKRPGQVAQRPGQVA